MATINAINSNIPIEVTKGGTAIIATGAAYAPICAGTTTTGAFQTASTGISTSGYILTSTGASSLPTFQAPAASSISITGDSGGALTGASFTFTAGSTGLSFGGSGSTETLSGTLAVANGGTNATSFATTDGVAYFDGTRLVVTGAGTSGQVLTSNGAGMAPTYQAASGGITTLDGNTGSATGSTVTIEESEVCSAQFVGSGSTLSLTLSDSNNNTILGTGSNYTSITGTFNVSLGNTNFAALTSGAGNSAIGYRSLNGVVSGSNNVAVGSNTLTLATGNNNVAVGSASLEYVVGGSRLTALGYQAGYNYSGSESSNICIGYATQGTSSESNVCRIGNATGTNPGNLNATYICGIAGANVGSVATVVTEASNQLGTAVLTAGSGIAITPTANVITIATTGPNIAWSVISADQNAAINNGYICNKGSVLTLTLPTTAAVGTLLSVTGMNTALGWKIAQNAGQQIFFGTSTTTSGTGGSLASSNIYDVVTILCNVANTSWIVIDSIGNITVV